MGQKAVQGFCTRENEWVMAYENKPNHILHLLLTIFTGGLWLIVWIIIANGAKGPICSRCGSPTISAKDKAELDRRAMKRRALADQEEGAEPATWEMTALKVTAGVLAVLIVTVFYVSA